MNREQLSHVLRAAATIVNDGDILVVGSQSILGTFDSDRLPEAAVMSVEADLAFFDDPLEEKMDLVDGAIGEGSQFHMTYGYYAQGVTIETAVLPQGWRERVIRYRRTDAAPSEAVCLEPHDLVIAKLVASREKDLEFTSALISSDLIQARTLLDRTEVLDQPEAVRVRVRSSIRKCTTRAGH